MSAEPAERREPYLFEHLGHHIGRLERPALREKLFRRLDEGFLAEQARHFQSFGPSLRLLEEGVLPLAIRSGDWERALRFALVAINLRGMAESLASPALLAALVGAGHGALAATLAAESPQLGRRVAACSAVAAALAGQPPTPATERVLDEVLQALQQDLDDTSTRTGERAAALAAAARRLAPDLRTRWAGWIAGLEEDESDAVRVALAEGWLLRQGAAAEQTWEALGAVRDARRLGDLLVRRARLLSAGDWTTTFARLRRLAKSDGGDLLARASVAVLGERSTAVRERAEAEWMTLHAQAAASSWFSWSLAVVEEGRRLWGALPPRRLAEIVAAAPEVLRAPLGVCALEGGGGERVAIMAEEAVRVLRRPAEWFHWETRRLAATRRRSGAAPADAVERLDERARAWRFAFEPVDLARYLELIAASRTHRLARRIEDVLWAPSSGAETLRTLAREAADERLVDALVDRAESYATAVGESESEAFELRRETLVRLGIRRCQGAGGLDRLRKIARRLLPEEEDELRAGLAGSLAIAGEAAPALEAARGIRSAVLRRRTRLELLAHRPPDESTLDPADLYAAVAATEAVEDELAMLAALCPDAGEASEDVTPLPAVAHRGRRLLGRIEQARHRLAVEAGLPSGSRDLQAAVLPLEGELGVVESDDRLVALTLEIASLAGALGMRRAAAELLRSVERVAARPGVSPTLRESALARLIGAGAALIVRGAAGLGDRRRLAALYRALLALPDSPEGGEEIRRLWHRLLPQLVSPLLALPPARWLQLEAPWRATCLSRLPQRLRPFASRLCGLAHPLPWRELARRRREWTWASGEQEAAIELCLDSGKRAARLERVLRAGGGTATIEVLAVLEGARRPAVLAALLAALPSGAARETLATYLLASGAIVGAVAATAVASAGGAPAVAAARVLADEASGVEDVAAALSLALVAADDPSTLPLRRRLRRGGGETCRRIAECLPAALAAGGRRGGEACLRLWLHAWFGAAPSGAARSVRDVAAMARTSRRARSIAARQALDQLSETAPRG